MLWRLSLGQRLTVFLIGVLFATFLAGALILNGVAASLTRHSAESAAASINQTLVDMVEVFVSQVEKGADRLMSALQLSIHEPFHLDPATTITIGDQPTPALRLGGRPVNADFTLVDHFTKETGGVATLFARRGDDFVRVSTSLKKEDGTRAVGTLLDRKHPAYAKVLAGEGFRGAARLFGRDYYTKYLPLSENGQVIGVLFIGADFTDELKALRERIKATKVGDSGYAYVLNAREGSDYGKLIVHPEKEGQSILDATDANGNTFIKAMLQARQGITTYPWQNAGESGSRDKVVAFGQVPSLNWLVASGAYIDDLGKIVGTLMLWVGGIGLTLAVLLPLLIYATVHVFVSRPLGDLQDFCQQVQATHDFTLSAPHSGEDEVGQTCAAVSRLLTTLRETFGNLMQHVLEVDRAAHHLAQTSQHASQQSDQASDSASAMAASVEEMTVGINHISENAEFASRLAKTAGERSADGGETIIRATDEMVEISREVSEASAVIHELGIATGRISGVIGVIKEVADQTNLLALNAAIEAARAGESGRGFAVVADEVRKLAERTALSTGEIAGMVSAIQSLSERATGIMRETVAQVEQGAQLAAHAGEAITEIQQNSRQVLDVVEEITLALGEQSSASQQIAQQTENVARVAEENSHAATHTAEAADRLERLGAAIRERVQQFRF